jgi:hypothetical protein
MRQPGAQADFAGRISSGMECAARLDEPIGTGWLLVPAVRPFDVLMVGVDGELLRLIAGDDRCRLRR